MNLNVRENESKTNAPFPAETNGAADVYYPESDGKPMAETDVHITLIATLLTTLRTFYAEQNVYVVGDIMFYYEEGNPRKSIAPDVLVVRSVEKYPRRVFKLWEESVPEVVFEISSRGTWREDFKKKFDIYKEIGVKEYYIFDPEYKYLKDDNSFVAFHLEDGAYKKIEIENGKIFSLALGLEIVNTGETLRLYNPETERFLPTNDELTDEIKQKDEEIKKLKAEMAKLKSENRHL